MQKPDKQDFSEEIKRISELAQTASDKLESGCTLGEFFELVDLIEYSCRVCKQMLVVQSKLTERPITIKGLPDRRSRKSGQ